MQHSSCLIGQKGGGTSWFASPVLPTIDDISTIEPAVDECVELHALSCTRAMEEEHVRQGRFSPPVGETLVIAFTAALVMMKLVVRLVAIMLANSCSEVR